MAFDSNSETRSSTRSTGTFLCGDMARNQSGRLSGSMWRNSKSTFFSRSTIVTAQGADGPAGFLGLSATHVCADPPSMLVSIDRKTSALAAVLHGHHFAINYLGRDARAIADMFAGKTAAKGSARFEPGRWGTLTTGAPVFDDAIGAVDCVLEKTIDHFATTVAIGRVV